ncbi:hypothetical protein AX16_010406 [Volvariella volvacea WC 439]|nr:hypothetical protein AX16_010406 [Volvariella volvacea WC 439]
MTLKLKPITKSPSPFSWDAFAPSPLLSEPLTLPSPPTSWLPAREMKLFGARPLTSAADIGIARCKDCDKPFLRSFVSEHVGWYCISSNRLCCSYSLSDNCELIRSGGKRGLKAKHVSESEDRKGGKKRKASPSPSDPSTHPKKKVKPATKVTKGRTKGPVDYDRQCGVINDKGLPCSRSLTCKSHSMGAKRAVGGRSRPYDELLLEWQRANNPNFVEPVKKISKAEKKEQKEREKMEKKREAAAALGIDPTQLTKKSAVSGTKKPGKKAAAAAAAAVKMAEELGEDAPENLDDLDSEAEMDDLVQVTRAARESGVIAKGKSQMLPGPVTGSAVKRQQFQRDCKWLCHRTNSGHVFVPTVRRVPPRMGRLISLFTLFFIVATTANALHFYLDANQKRCFIEELPSHTVVEGHYRALEWSEVQQTYVEKPDLGIVVEVEDIARGDMMVKTTGPPDSRFTFTSHDAGDHSICLSTNYTSWFSSTHIRLYLDIVVGSTKPDIEQDRSHVSELASKIRDLNQKLEDIRREQQYQREREAQYRDLSEATNARAVWYSVAQIVVLIATCAWQLRHLKSFFEDRKMR